MFFENNEIQVQILLFTIQLLFAKSDCKTIKIRLNYDNNHQLRNHNKTLFL